MSQVPRHDMPTGSQAEALAPQTVDVKAVLVSEAMPAAGPPQPDPMRRNSWLPVTAVLGGAALAMLGALVIHQNDNGGGALAALRLETEAAAAQAETRLKTVEATSRAALEGQAKTIAALDKRLKDAEAKLGAIPAMPLTSAVQAPDLSGEIAKVTARVETVDQRLGAVETNLAAPKTALQVTESKIEPISASSMAAQLAIAQSLLAALERGAPYADEIAALETLGANPAGIAQLKAKPVASLAQLSADLKQASAAMLAPNAQSATKETGWLEQIGASVGTLVEVRKVGEAAKGNVAGQIAMLEGALAKADLAGALAGWEKLPADAKANSQAWADSVKTRMTALEAARGLVSAAITGLSSKRP